MLSKYIEQLLFFTVGVAPWPTILLDTMLPKQVILSNVHEISTNYFGASIFVSYIVAALLLIILISQDLLDAYHRARLSNHGTLPQRNLFAVFVLFALLSFTVLSYNMLLFLIQSYLTWSRFNAKRGTSLTISVWQWMTTSTLFLDFARDLCRTEEASAWTDKALVATLLSVVHMNAEGRRKEINHMLRYFLIGQILPISFAQNLFFVALILKGMSKIPQQKKAKRASQLSNYATELSQASRVSIWILLAIYRVLIAILPRITNSSAFITLVLATRVLLFLPVMSNLSNINLDVSFSTPLLIVCTALTIFFSGLDHSDLQGNYAVSALGVDMLISILSVGVWNFRQ